MPRLFLIVLLVLLGLLALKTAIVWGVVRQFLPNNRKALRTGLVVSMGGEFGFALLLLLLKGSLVEAAVIQPLLTAVALSMLPRRCSSNAPLIMVGM